MSTDDTQTDEQQLEPDEPTTTRRKAMIAGASLGAPMFWGSSSDLGYFDTHWIANSGQKLAIDPEVINFGSGIKAVETDEGVDIIVPELDGSSSGSGAFEDTDDDGIAELQDDHADFQGGEARGISGLAGDIASNPVTSLEGTNLSVDENGNLNASGGSGSVTRLDDLEDVDVTGWLEGAVTDRPATDDVPSGVRYRATDQGITYRNTASNGWIAAGGTGTTNSPLPEQHVQTLSAAEELINADSIGDLSYNDHTPLLVGTTEDNRSIGVVVQNDQKEDSNGNLLPGYSGTYSFLTTEGERIAWIAGDAEDRHVHLYVKPDSIGSGDTQPQPHTRWQIEGGNTVMETGAMDSGATQVRIVPGGTEDYSMLTFWNGDREPQFYQMYRPTLGTSGKYRFSDRRDRSTVLDYDYETRSWGWNGTPLTELREISNPTPSDLGEREWAWDATDGRWLFKDSGGTAHYFTPDGTL